MVASMIELAMAELMKKPEELKRVQQELATGLDCKVNQGDLDKLSYLRFVVKETLYLHSTDPPPPP